MGVAIDRRDVLIKKTRSFARVAHAIKFSRMTHLADERAAKQALKIEGDIRAQTARLAQPREQVLRHAKACEVTARENVDMIDRAVAAQERSPLGVDHPRDFGRRIRIAQERCGGQGMDNIAERTRLDDENGASQCAGFKEERRRHPEAQDE